MTGVLDGLRVGYAPCGRDLAQPGDRRRFCFYADRRGVPFEIAEPDGDYDIVVVTSMADIVSWRERPAGRTKIVYDLVDSYLAVSRFQPRSLLRGVAKFAARQTRSLVLDFRSAIEDMCRRSDAVVCSTDEQRAQILEFCPNVHVVLDDHSELGPVHKTNFTIGNPVNLVWEGLAYTLGGFDGIVDVLRDLAEERPVALHLITDISYPRYARRFGRAQTEKLARGILPETYLYQWNRHLLPHIATACDVALIPLDLGDPFARGKPENKLLIFWRLGMPTITSATPAYTRTMRKCGLDLTCATPDDWATTLRRVLAEEDVRAGASKQGREFVESYHSEEQLLARWDRLFESVLG